jgi:hypothetical protein
MEFEKLAVLNRQVILVITSAHLLANNKSLQLGFNRQKLKNRNAKERLTYLATLLVGSKPWHLI